MSLSPAHKFLHEGRLDEAARAAQSMLEREPQDGDALNVLGIVALRRGRPQEALHLVQAAVAASPANALARHYLGRVHAMLGDPRAAAAAHRKALDIDPAQFLVRLHLGASLEHCGEVRQAAIQYARATHEAQAQGRWLDAQTTAPAVRPMVERAVRCVRNIRRELLDEVLAPLRSEYGRQAMGRVEQCLRMYLGEERVQYADPRQRPTFLYFPNLPPAPYLDRALFPWIEQLESAASAIHDELLALLDAGASERVFTSDALERENLRGASGAPKWTGYYFWRHGERREENCPKCPRTAQALARIPLSHVREHGPEVLFSIFAPGTHLLPHRGVTNTRLVGHLPLIVPPDCALSVAGEAHAWREGRVVIFDDTYEHEAWNRSREMRVVLIFDVWNPHLTEAERQAVAALVAAIGDFRQAVQSA